MPSKQYIKPSCCQISATAKISNRASIWHENILTIASILRENMLGYLSTDIICSEKLRARKTVRLEEQIMSKGKYTSIFSRQMEAIVLLNL